MKNTILSINSLLLLLSIATLNSCVTIGNNIFTQITRSNDIPCTSPPSEIYVFLDGEIIDFEYQTIGEVEATGEMGSSNNEILDHLKYEAWKNCANGIIFVRSTETVREYGSLLDTENQDQYIAKKYIGLAVVIKPYEGFAEEHKHKPDSQFIDRVEKTLDQYAQNEEAEVTITVIAIIGGLVGGAFALLRGGS